jgi:hypothetical protein
VLRDAKNSHSDLWNLVPGDLIARWKSNYFDTRSNLATPRQLEERNFYVPCARCKRYISQINAEGRLPACGKNCSMIPRRTAAVENRAQGN